ncbi:MAG: metabolite traffic protein EboE [Planctomycetota bacterium]
MTSAPRLTYCGNVHAADDVDGWLAGLDLHAAPVARAAAAAGRAFGLGAWWPAPVAAAIAGDPAVRDRVAAHLHARGLVPWTLNVFPFAGFHDAVVKTAVYAPDWETEERLLYTRHCAEAVAALVPAGSVVPLSTLPLGYRAPGAGADLRRMARNLARAASMLAAVRERTGVHCVLALEPEPFCLLESCAQAAEFLEQWMFEEGAWPTVPAAALRAHLGVCVDLCHLFVIGEDPVAAISDLQRRGIAVPKVQVSSCLEVRAADGLDRLLGFDEPRYLHQTVAAAGPRALDLDGVRRDRDRFADALRGGPVRTHYHMPIWWDEDGAFGSTRAALDRALRALRSLRPAPVFEVETYTWSVLGDFGGAEPLAVRLARELDHAAKLLGA